MVLEPTCVYPSIRIFKTTWPIKGNFYMKRLYERGTNVYISNSGHMNKMAAMPIYGKIPSKIFFSMTWIAPTKLGLKHL